MRTEPVPCLSTAGHPAAAADRVAATVGAPSAQASATARLAGVAPGHDEETPQLQLRIAALEALVARLLAQTSELSRDAER